MAQEDDLDLDVDGEEQGAPKSKSKLLVIIVGVVLLNMAVLQGADLESWTLPAGQLAQLQEQRIAYWGQAWAMPLLAALERLFSIIFHMGMAVLVLAAVIRRQPVYLLLAVALHTATNALAVITLSAGWSPIATEAVIGLFALLALGIIIWFRSKDIPQAEAMPSPQVALPALAVGPRRPPTLKEQLRRQIEKSKYEG